MGLRYGRMAAIVLFAGYISYGTTVKADDKTVATATPTENNQELTKPVSQADNSSASIFTLPEVVVTAPLASINTSRYGDEMDTVSSGQIDDLNAQDLPTALRTVPGVIISQYNEMGNYGGGDGGAIYLRGQGSGRPGAEITTMVDGIPLFAGVWTHPLMDQLSINNASVIDVYKSAQPVLIGNMGFGAVNMIPKTMGQPGFETQVQAEAGANQTYTQTVETGGKIGDADYYLTGGHWISDGIRPNSNGEVYEGSAHLGFNLGSGVTATGYVAYNNSSTDDPGEVGATPLPITQNFMFDSTMAIFDLSHQDGAWSGSVKGYWNTTNINWYEWDSWNLSPYNSYAWSSNFGYHLKEKWAADGSEIVLGFDNDFYGGHTQDIYPVPAQANDDSSNPPQFANYAPYVMLSQSIVMGGGVTLIPSAGVRYNINRYLGSIAGPQAGLKLDDSADSFYFGYAHGFNYPGVYVAINQPGQWQNLEPEIDDHLEVGWNRKFTREFSTNLVVFRDNVTNALWTDPADYDFNFANVGSYQTQGIELDAQWTPKNLPQWFAGGTYLDSTPSDVPNAPQWTFQGGMNAEIADVFRLNLDIQYASQQNTINLRYPGPDAWVNGFVVLNGKLSYSINPKNPKNNTELFIACENIGAEDYEFRPGYPMAKDAWMAGLESKF